MIKTLSAENLTQICEYLADQDTALQDIFSKYGTPPLWKREANFATLIHIILEQQVSLASALAAFNKLQEKLGTITPENVYRLTDEELKACYFSRQKTLYAKELAKTIIARDLDLEALPVKSDKEVRENLKKIKGVGDWTADIYLLMALLRADVMPKGDLALHAAYRKITNAEKRPNSDEFQVIAQKWQPYRAVAARLLWHYYLSN